MLIIKIYNISYLTYNQPQAKKVRIAGDPIGLYEHISNCKIVNLNIYDSITLMFLEHAIQMFTNTESNYYQIILFLAYFHF